MEAGLIHERKTCPNCLGQINRITTGDEPGDHLDIAVCQGNCKKEFMPPWPEFQWSEPDSRPIPVELTISYSEEGTPLIAFPVAPQEMDDRGEVAAAIAS